MVICSGLLEREDTNTSAWLTVAACLKREDVVTLVPWLTVVVCLKGKMLRHKHCAGLRTRLGWLI